MKQLNKHTLHGFTLFELILALALSTFIVFTGMYTLRIFSKQFKNYRDINEKLFETAAFGFIIKHDASKASTMKRQNQQLILEKENQSIVYDFSFQNLITRIKQQNIDTFFIEHKNMVSFFENQAKNISFIDLLRLECKPGTKWLFLHVEKTYSAKQLMKIKNKKQN